MDRSKGGRPPFTPTDEQRLRVSIEAACGLNQDLIRARIINPQTGQPIDRLTLRRKFKDELAQGQATANSLVAQSLFKKATGSGPQSVTAAIFWLKCRAGWKPTEGLEITGKDGAPLPGVPEMTEAQLEKLARKIADEV